MPDAKHLVPECQGTLPYARLGLALRVVRDFWREFAEHELTPQIVQRVSCYVEKAVANRQADAAITCRMVQV